MKNMKNFFLIFLVVGIALFIGGGVFYAINRSFYKDAEKIIYDELSYVLEIDKADVIGFITNTLEAN